MDAAGYLRRWTQEQTSLGPRSEAVAGYDDDNVRCKVCESEEAVAELMLCNGCGRGFHIFYLCPHLPVRPRRLLPEWCYPCCHAPTSFKSNFVAELLLRWIVTLIGSLMQRRITCFDWFATVVSSN
jgi:[histone H3]-lysine27 N-methyltransferase